MTNEVNIEMTKDNSDDRPVVPNGMTAWNAAVSVYAALKLTDKMARGELEDAETEALNNPRAPGLMSRRQLVALLMDARNTLSYDLNQWARANGEPLVD